MPALPGGGPSPSLDLSMKRASSIATGLTAAAFAFGAAAAEPGHLKLQYAGYLVGRRRECGIIGAVSGKSMATGRLEPRPPDS